MSKGESGLSPNIDCLRASQSYKTLRLCHRYATSQRDLNGVNMTELEFWISRQKETALVMTKLGEGSEMCVWVWERNELALGKLYHVWLFRTMLMDPTDPKSKTGFQKSTHVINTCRYMIGAFFSFKIILCTLPHWIIKKKIEKPNLLTVLPGLSLLCPPHFASLVCEVSVFNSLSRFWSTCKLGKFISYFSNQWIVKIRFFGHLFS